MPTFIQAHRFVKGILDYWTKSEYRNKYCYKRALIGVLFNY